jgi:hypothetical protein
MPTKANAYKKKVFVEKMKKTLGNITASSEAAGINRCTYYEWYEKDPDFRAAIDAISESCIDFAESSLMQQIKDGNPTSTIFYLKTKGKKRGYIETQELTGKDGKDLIPAQMTDDEIKKELERIRKSRNE